MHFTLWLSHRRCVCMDGGAGRRWKLQWCCVAGPLLWTQELGTEWNAPPILQATKSKPGGCFCSEWPVGLRYLAWNDTLELLCGPGLAARTEIVNHLCRGHAHPARNLHAHPKHRAAPHR